jgi:hypothetical protein
MCRQAAARAKRVACTQKSFLHGLVVGVHVTFAGGLGCAQLRSFGTIHRAGPIPGRRFDLAGCREALLGVVVSPRGTVVALIFIDGALTRAPSFFRVAIRQIRPVSLSLAGPSG